MKRRLNNVRKFCQGDPDGYAVVTDEGIQGAWASYGSAECVASKIRGKAEIKPLWFRK